MVLRKCNEKSVIFTALGTRHPDWCFLHQQQATAGMISTERNEKNQTLVIRIFGKQDRYQLSWLRFPHQHQTSVISIECNEKNGTDWVKLSGKHTPLPAVTHPRLLTGWFKQNAGKKDTCSKNQEQSQSPNKFLQGHSRLALEWYGGRNNRYSGNEHVVT